MVGLGSLLVPDTTAMVGLYDIVLTIGLSGVSDELTESVISEVLQFWNNKTDKLNIISVMMYVLKVISLIRLYNNTC